MAGNGFKFMSFSGLARIRMPFMVFVQLLTLATGQLSSVCFQMSPSPKLAFFVDPLPTPPSINVSDGRNHVIKAFKIKQVRCSAVGLPARSLVSLSLTRNESTFFLLMNCQLSSVRTKRKEVVDRPHFGGYIALSLDKR